MTLEEKKQDLKSTRQKAIIQKVMQSLAESHPDFYYLPTIELAAEIQAYIRAPGNFQHEDVQDVVNLSRRDIQLLLGLHNQD